jgi:uncharacterized protein
MATLIPLLRRLHRLNSLARDLRDQLDRFPNQLKAQKAKLVRQEDARREAQEALKRLKVATHEKEVSLRSAQQQIERWEKQLNEVTAKKEYDALQHELAAARQTCQKLEDEILAGMIAADERTAGLPGLDAALKQAQAEFAEFEASAGQRRGDLAGRLDEVIKEIREAEGELPAAARPQYDRLTQAMGADALSPVVGRSCRACMTGITAQEYNDLLVDACVFCKACGRLLYLPEPP